MSSAQPAVVTSLALGGGVATHRFPAAIRRLDLFVKEGALLIAAALIKEDSHADILVIGRSFCARIAIFELHLSVRSDDRYLKSPLAHI